jgi:hypothetical protein
MLGFAALCELPLSGLPAGAAPTPPLTPAELAQLYGGRAVAGKRKREEEQEASIEVMVRAIAVDPDLGKKAVVAALPKTAQRRFLPNLPVVRDEELIRAVQTASAAVRARIVGLYQELEEEEDDELMLMLI